MIPHLATKAIPTRLALRCSSRARCSGLGILASFWRLVRGPSLADRVVALDLIGYLVIGVMVVLSIVTQRESFLFVPVVAAIILFLGTAAFAIYLERRQQQ
jgi:multicomponent Na+:H+ antiporter subunit F